jgi:UDP-N-acetylmuramoyl-tripeptide--D-alanyl-D-alanine ligase
MSFQWTDQEVRMALGMASSHPASPVEFTRVSTDSRSVEPGDLFLALHGENFDGHRFVSDAMGRGALGAVVSQGVGTEEGTPLYPVEDTLLALGQLANHRRNALDAKVVGITGSSGKTSTKELLRETLSGSFRVHATQGNLNNRIGLPLTLLAAPDNAEAVVLEMGTNEPGEIGALTAVAQPDIGVITTVSETHLEKLGSLGGVLEEKLDLLRGLPEDGLGVVGDDPPILQERARELSVKLLTTGWSHRVNPENRPGSPAPDENGCYRFQWKGEGVVLQVPGRHSVQNALLALAVADAMGVPARDAARRIGGVRAGAMRSELRRLGSLTLLVDCYNANPQSLRAALDLLGSLKGSGRRVAVLGSMLELGPDSSALHLQALEDALTFPVDLIVATGLFAEAAGELGGNANGPELVVAPELDEAEALLQRVLGGAESVLLKASRGVAMETLIPGLEERFGKGEVA